MKTFLFAVMTLVYRTDSQDISNRKVKSDYLEQYRPQYHFSPPENWINDPNGCLYHDGEYHLFYQYNPFGDTWGHMSWGHAVSTDLLHWQHLDVAIWEEDGIMIFSGSAIVDKNNTSGLGTTDNPPMIAFYTGHMEREGGGILQDQRIAYSLDNGRTFTKYENNPVLDLDMTDFRDPWIMWHEPSAAWRMVVAASADRKMMFFGSDNMIDWELLSKFGPAGLTGIWECPSLIELEVEGEGYKKWVLLMSSGPNKAQYFIGDYDGVTFTNDNPEETVLLIDHSRDFYAVQAFNGVEDGRNVAIGWANDWTYAESIPTNPWRGSMSLPRDLSLRLIDGSLRLISSPIPELKSLRGQSWTYSDMGLDELNEAIEDINTQTLEIDLTIKSLPPAGRIGLKVLKNDDAETIIGCNIQSQQMYIDVSQSGDTDFHQGYVSTETADVSASEGVNVRIFTDLSSVEVFSGDGQSTLTRRVFPPPGAGGLEAFVEDVNGDSVRFDVEIFEIARVWGDVS